jgi:hypothetical protein
MTSLKLGDTVRHRFDGGAVGEIIEIRTTLNQVFRLLRVRWASGSGIEASWETEEDLTTAG